MAGTDQDPDDADSQPDDDTDDPADGGGEPDDPRDAPYLVQLLTQAPARVDGAALLARLNQRCGQVVALGDFSDDLLSYAFEDHRTLYQDGPMAAMCMVTPGDHLSPAHDLETAAQQTWDWDGARAASAAARHSLVISDFCANGLPRQERLALFRGLVAAVLDVQPALALHWLPSRRLVDPGAFLAAGDPLYPAVNVRLFKISDRRPGEVVMDTVGLAPFGLPDLQVHFVPDEPLTAPNVAHFLNAVAHYQFERGPVIESGHSVPGPAGQKFPVRLEQALVGPARPVLDIDPGPPYSAR